MSLMSFYLYPIPAVIILAILFIRKRMNSITVKWGRERLRFPLPSPETKLSELRRSISEYTHLPDHSFKLVHAGAVMKDDNAPLSAYNIRSSSTLAIIGGPSEQQQQPSKKKTPTTEQDTISQIQSELEKVRSSLLPSVDTFLHTLSPGSSPPPPTSYTLTPEQEHTRLAELLLQSLLRLDAIATDGSWEQARKERKGAVREVQGLLDRLDVAWKSRPASL